MSLAACTNLSIDLDTIKTDAPYYAKTLVISFPIPDEAPVTKYLLFWRLIPFISSMTF